MFGAAGLAFAALALLSLTAWRRRAAGSGLPVAFMIQALWCATVFASAWVGLTYLPLLVGAELLRGLAWLWVLASGLAVAMGRPAGPRLLRMVQLAAALGVASVAWIAATATDDRAVVRLTNLWSWSGLLVAICGLALVEQFARNAREDARWRLKPIWLGIGILMALDLAYWSVVLLLGAPAGLLGAARAVVNLLTVALMWIGLRRIPEWDSRLFRSSGVLLLNTTLVVAGCYVLGMAAASWLQQSPLHPSGPLVQAVFFGASIVVLAVALFSDQFRAWFRVSLAKLLPLRYDYREGWLKLTRALSAASDVPLHDRVPEAIASLVNSGSACLLLGDEAGSLSPAGGNRALAHGAQSLPAPFVQFLRERDWIYDLEAARAGTLRDGVPDAPGALLENRSAWLLVPLVCNDGLVGVVVIGQPLAPTELGWEQLDLLRVSGRQAASYLAFEQAATRLAELHQFEALNRLSGFVMHDLRHLVAQLALVVGNAGRHRHNPEFIDDAILTIDSSVQRMTALMETLKTGAIVEPERRVDLAEACREVCARLSAQPPAPRLDAPDGPVDVMANRERLVQALEHLLRNAQQATPASGTVTLRLERRGRRAGLEIADTGVGMDAEFVRSRLFKPFDSTKGDKGMGLGAYEARDIVRKLGGSLTVESEPGQGTRFRIDLPLAPALEPVTDGAP